MIDTQSTWDAHWYYVNQEFKNELQSLPDPRIRSFQGKMFHVWDGNTRTIAWLVKIGKEYKQRPGMHVRVGFVILDAGMENLSL
jgi:hypothetical protein